MEHKTEFTKNALFLHDCSMFAPRLWGQSSASAFMLLLYHIKDRICSRKSRVFGSTWEPAIQDASI
jgi:hypothetical protein